VRRSARAFALAIILTGCATYSLVEPRRTAIGDLYTVDPQIPWSSTQTGKVEVWTVDGPSLQAVRFVKGLDDGEALFGGKAGKKSPKFTKAMAALEIMEFVVDSVTALGAQKVEAANLRPQRFGNVQGFRFDLRFASKAGLEEEGLVVGALAKERLHLIIYTGTRAHYFPKHKDHVERMIESISLR
jgi:hypothetical protein